MSTVLHRVNNFVRGKRDGRLAEPDGPPTFGEVATRFIESGYAPCPARWTDRQPIGPYAVYQGIYGREHATDGVAILCTCPPPRGPGASIPHPRETYMVALSVDVRNRKAMDEIRRAIAKHTNGATAAPVREASDGSALWPFALEGEPFGDVFTCSYRLPGDRGPYVFKPHRAEAVSLNRFFIASGLDAAGVPYTWSGGDLLTVPRAALPILSAGSARPLVNDIENVLVRHGGKRV